MAKANNNLKVAVRVRPFNKREINRQAKCVISMKGNSTTISNPYNGDIKRFTFDYSYWSHDGYSELETGQLEAENSLSDYADQKTVFDDLGQGVLQNAWEGYNATLFAYGQTGSGKSYSMIGHGCNRGIVPITCGELFQAIDKVERSEKELQVRESQKIGFYVEGLSQHPCRDYSTIEQLMEMGAINRTTASTNMNATSSRSHMLISIKFKQIFNNDVGESTTKVSEINLVDLAGSERADSTGATGDRLKEGSAINKSLLMLGSVIEKLAAGDSRTVIPYRDSVLTKLLKSALGGNSKTVMIAALSPADINYDETLSTLRYADRAKKITNRAVVNESPTDRLIRELKEENAKLLAQLNKHSPGNSMLSNDEVKRLIAQNEMQMREMTMSWEQKLEAARKEWESEQKLQENKETNLDFNHPYLQNVNEDPQLSGIIKHSIHDGITMIGRYCVESKYKHHITLKGLGIQDEQCLITSSWVDNEMILEPCKNADVTVNGLKVLIQTTLKHGDRLKLGSNVLFLYIGFPDERGTHHECLELAERCDYDYFQSEFLSTTSISRDINVLHQDDFNKQIAENPVYLEYIHLLPVVEGLNAMSQEMEKNIEFHLMVKNLTTCDEYGKEITKEVIVQVKHQVTNQIWVWPRNKFINRRYMIEELYMNYQDDPKILASLLKEDDPFWDPIEDVYIGCAHTWLHSLAYCMSCEEHATVHSHSGNEEGMIDISISPCSASGEIKGDELMVIDPNQLLGKRLDLIIIIKQCLKLRWIEENSTRGITLRFKFSDENFGHHSPDKWHSVNPKINMRERIIVENVSPAFLQYLHSAALVVELWGLQAGKVDQPSPTQDNGFFLSSGDFPAPSSPSVSSQSSGIEILEQELLKTQHQLQSLDDDNKDLRKICNILEKENAKLKRKAQVKKSRSGNVSTSDKSRAFPISREDDKLPSANRVQAELGRALKSFFTDVRHIQKDLQDVSLEECGSESGQIVQISQNLDQVLGTLKSGVAAAVRIHKLERRSSLGDVLSR